MLDEPVIEEVLPLRTTEDVNMESCVPAPNNQISTAPREPFVVNIQYPEPARSPYTVFIIFFLTVLSAAFLHDFFPKFLQERKLQEA